MELFQMSLSAAVMILAVILIRTVFVNQLPKKTFLILWGMVLLRLFMPASIPAAVSIDFPAGGSVLLRILTGSGAGSPASSEAVSGQAADGQKESTQASQGQDPQSRLKPDPQLQNEAAAQTWKHEDAAEHGAGPSDWLLEIQRQADRAVWFWVWCAGAAVCALFFITAYIRARLEFRMSLPAADVPALQQMSALFEKLRRPVSVRQLDKVPVPLTYGIFHPVILLPKQIFCCSTQQLRYVLLHEYVHIRRLDAAVKLAVACALCIHWFNPFVWGMYVLFNRDLELACDESVVRQIGSAQRAEYAGMLIKMEAAKSGLAPFGSCFSKNAAEERITAIMKMKKNSIGRVAAAAVLTAGVAALSVLSAAGSAQNPAAFLQKEDKGGADSAGGDIHTGFVSDAGQAALRSGKKSSGSADIYTGADLPFTEKEFKKLLALKVKGYEKMSISKYRRKVWKMTDTSGYTDLLERFIQNQDFQELEDVNEAASFLFHIIVPLTMEAWEDGTYSFGGYAEKDAAGAVDRALLEYTVTLSIQDPDSLTVGEYDKTRLKMMKGLGSVLTGRTPEELADEALTSREAQKKADSLAKKWSTKKLKVSADCFYSPLVIPEGADEKDAAADEGEEEIETRHYPNAAKEDYASLLALMTPDYKNMSLKEFNRRLLDWGNEDYERHERITCDRIWNDYAVSLTEEEKYFVENTVVWSMMENKQYVESLNTGKPEEDPETESDLEREEAGVHDGFAWCRLVYDWSYHISDKDKVTVGERDRSVGGFHDSIRGYFYESDIDSLVKMPENEMMKKVQQAADAYTNSRVVITLTEKGMYQTQDSRDFIYHDE